jgi:Protein of unknown function (DUF5663)
MKYVGAMSDSPMFHLDPDLLWELGFRSLTRVQVSDLLSEIYDVLELRVGTRLADRMDSNQLANFERIIAKQDERGALAFLASSFPHYKEEVLDEINHIVRLLRRAAELPTAVEGYSKPEAHLEESLSNEK